MALSRWPLLLLIVAFVLAGALGSGCTEVQEIVGDADAAPVTFDTAEARGGAAADAVTMPDPGLADVQDEHGPEALDADPAADGADDAEAEVTIADAGPPDLPPTDGWLVEVDAPGDREAETDSGADDVEPDAELDAELDVGPDGGPDGGPEVDADPAPECLAVSDCDDDDACTVDLCDGAAGTCSQLAVICDDGLPCTLDSCDPGAGCLHIADDTLTCDDGLACTDDDHCAQGVCAATPCQCQVDADCAGQVLVGDCARPACSFGWCTVGPDPLQDGLGCDDGFGCTEGSVCAGGVCGGGVAADCAWVVTGDCQVGWCDPAIQQCVPVAALDGEDCDDDDVCTKSDRCTAGVCGGTPVSCDDHEPCNGLEGCDPLTGCVAGTPLPCNDGDACNGVETCEPGQGCKFGAPLTCDDGDPCNGVETCDPATGCEGGTALLCDDGDACNGVEICLLEAGGCIGTPGLECDDGDDCNGIESCDPAVGCVDGEAPVCDDGDPCTGAESCDPATGECVPGVALSCDDGDPCNGAEACVAEAGCVTGAPPECGLYACVDGIGCQTSCAGAGGCVDGAWCDQTGDPGICALAAADGEPCELSNACASSHCDNGLCCAAGGTCCATVADCPEEFDALSQQQTVYYTKPAEGPWAFALIDPTLWAAQSWIAGLEGPLSRVRFMLSAPLGAEVPMELQLWSGNLPILPGAKLVSTVTWTLVHDDPVGPVAHEVVFPDPPEIKPGDLYLFVLRATGPPAGCAPDADCGGPALWFGATANPYVFGTVFRSSDAGESYTVTTTGEDLWFQAFVGLKSCVDHQCKPGLAPDATRP